MFPADRVFEQQPGGGRHLRGPTWLRAGVGRDLVVPEEVAADRGQHERENEQRVDDACRCVHAQPELSKEVPEPEPDPPDPPDPPEEWVGAGVDGAGVGVGAGLPRSAAGKVR